MSLKKHGKGFSEALREIKVLYTPNSDCSTKIQKEFVEYVTSDKVCGATLDNG